MRDKIFNGKFDTNKLRVAKPCHVGWENMTGDEKSRLCNSCEMNVYNISEMTKAEIVSLIETREGRLCGRIFERADGTVITKDCPVGIRAYHKKVSRMATTAFAAILGLVSIGFGQNDDKTVERNENVTITRSENQNEGSTIQGIITDSKGARIPGATISLRKKDDKKFVQTQAGSPEGAFEFTKLPAGRFDIEITVLSFTPYRNKKLVVGKNEFVEISIALEPSDEIVVVGVFAQEPLIDMTNSGVTTKISGDMLRIIPGD